MTLFHAGSLALDWSSSLFETQFMPIGTFEAALRLSLSARRARIDHSLGTTSDIARFA